MSANGHRAAMRDVITEPGGARVDRGFMTECDHEAEADFLKQEGALHAAMRWGVQPLLAVATLVCLAFTLGYFGRAAGLF